MITTSTTLATWGAILSTILAAIKIWEVFSNRIRLVIGYSFDSRDEVGNTIIIANPSNTPVMIDFYELLWIGGHFGKRKKYPVLDSTDVLDMQPCDITIMPHSRHSLNFANEYNFDWHCRADKEAKLYIRLHIIGKGNLIKLVYPNKINTEVSSSHFPI